MKDGKGNSECRRYKGQANRPFFSFVFTQPFCNGRRKFKSRHRYIKDKKPDNNEHKQSLHPNPFPRKTFLGYSTSDQKLSQEPLNRKDKKARLKDCRP